MIIIRLKKIFACFVVWSYFIFGFVLGSGNYPLFVFYISFYLFGFNGIVLIILTIFLDKREKRKNKRDD